MRTQTMNWDTETELANRIVQLVEAHWTEHKKPLLLSDLGSLENGAIGKVAKETSGSLKAYLQDHLSDRVTVVQHSSKLAVIGALPAGAEIDEDLSIDDLFFVSQKQTVQSVARYHPAVWAAFRKPLANDKLRYVSRDGVLHFVDVTTESAPEGFVKLDGELIDAGDGDPRLIESRILQWIDQNGLDVTRFLLKRTASGSKFPSNDLLSEVLTSLEVEDLRRISMPLDIVQKLRSKQR